MNKSCLVILPLLLLLSLSAFAQRFNAGLTLGMNLSQLDGDQDQGYKKTGLQIGLRGTAVITKRLEFSTGLLYSQKGSAFQKTSFQEKIKLNYMEVPILINYKSKYIEEKKLYRWQWFTGISVGRLINSSVEEDIRDDLDFTATEEFLKSSDIGYIIGFNYYFDHHFAIGMESSVSLTKAYNSSKNPIEENNVRGLRNYLLSFRLLYMLW